MQVLVVTAVWMAYTSRWIGSFGSSVRQISIETRARISLYGITSEKCANCPYAQGGVVQQLHPHIHGEPRRWADEELVMIRIDVELADVGDERGFDGLRVKRRKVDA